MTNFKYLFLYLVVFGLSYQGLKGGGTDIIYIDVLLTNIFFIFSYVTIFTLKTYRLKENIISIPIIFITSCFYFYQINIYLLLVYLIIFFILMFLKTTTKQYDPIKSILYNFYKCSSKIDISLISLFIFISLLLKFL